MDFYYNDDGYFDELFSSFQYGKNYSWLKKNHKRILFTMVLLYISYRLFGLLYRWMISLFESKNSLEDNIPQSEPIIRRITENILVVTISLVLGCTMFYVHQDKSTFTNISIWKMYRRIIYELARQSVGFDLERSSSLNQNESLVVGSILAFIIIYIMLSMVRFIRYHYIFGFVIIMLGIVLYFYQFPITSTTAANYSGHMFIIDHKRQTAKLVPNLIPKFLLTLTIGYYLFLVLLKSFTLFLKVSFRFIVCSLICTILLNSIASMLNQPNSVVIESSSTTFTPNHQY
ncbi:hypothetical protein BLOT_002756 [Blomia tropicalis]|nr:hypothetical protein BLOT_002756 [Blomia tropicalis]